jgi:hypothetical protein
MSVECDIIGNTSNKNETPLLQDTISEKKLRKKEYNQKWWSNRTEEQKQKHRDSYKKYYLNNIVKERSRLKENRRIYRLNLTEEQRLHRNEVGRKYIIKNKENIRKQKQKYKNSERGYANRIKRTYGLKIEEVKQMLIDQKESCAICLNKFKNKKDTQIDHNHLNGKVRQLLCSSCNRGLGSFKEDITIFNNAIKYIYKWNYNSSNENLCPE